MTSRRSFFAALAGAAAIALDPERDLWLPGAKLISIPKPQMMGPGLIMHRPQVGHFDPKTGLYHWRIDCVVVTENMTREEFTRRHPDHVTFWG